MPQNRQKEPPQVDYDDLHDDLIRVVEKQAGTADIVKGGIVVALTILLPYLAYMHLRVEKIEAMADGDHTTIQDWGTKAVRHHAKCHSYQIDGTRRQKGE